MSQKTFREYQSIGRSPISTYCLGSVTHPSAEPGGCHQRHGARHRTLGGRERLADRLDRQHAGAARSPQSERSTSTTAKRLQSAQDAALFMFGPHAGVTFTRVQQLVHGSFRCISGSLWNLACFAYRNAGTTGATHTRIVAGRGDNASVARRRCLPLWRIPCRPGRCGCCYAPCC